MTKKDSDLQVSPSRRSTREYVGLIVNGTNAAVAIKTIAAAEIAGVQQIWMTNTPWFPDVLTTLAAAAIQTSTIRL
jgi:alkanesulfonate monooxygenase SsuD/methylene tetrahydromethanopterin reductase-like flavin-dependent oxidoreductase (luciferase family)